MLLHNTLLLAMLLSLHTHKALKITLYRVTLPYLRNPGKPSIFNALFLFSRFQICKKILYGIYK